jgi:hypothetical protein
MFLDLSTRLSTLLATGTSVRRARPPRAKARWPRISWPTIKVQTVRQTCQGIRVTDVALSFSGWEPPKTGASNSQPRFEGTVYFVWKRKN